MKTQCLIVFNKSLIKQALVTFRPTYTHNNLGTRMTLIKSLVLSLLLSTSLFAVSFNQRVVETGANSAEFQVEYVSGMTLMGIHYSKNKSLPGVGAGDWNFDVTTRDAHGRYSHVIKETLNPGDVINYWVLCIINGGGYQYTNQSYTFIGGPVNHSIHATSGSNGSISPSGTVSVSDGDSQTFTVTPTSGYLLDSLYIDGSSVTPQSSYTFSSVSANHTIHATCATIPVPTHTITASADSTGTISPAGPVTVDEHTAATFAITPNSGYVLDSLYIDGSPYSGQASYTFSDVTANHTIHATFSFIPIPTYTLTASTDGNGGVTPTSAIVPQHGSQIFTFIPQSGYQLSEVLVDGAIQPLSNPFTITNIDSNHTILGRFTVVTIPTHTIAATAGPGGSITPSGIVTVIEGTHQTFSITPQTGYEIDQLIVDGLVQPDTIGYTFFSVTQNHTISVTFNNTTGETPTSEMLSISGKLYDIYNAPINDTIEMSIKLFTAKNGGVEVYQETFFDAQAIDVINALFVIQLGTGASALNLKDVVGAQPSLYVEVTVGRGATSDTMQPRMALTASAYTLSQ